MRLRSSLRYLPATEEVVEGATSSIDSRLLSRARK